MAASAMAFNFALPSAAWGDDVEGPALVLAARAAGNGACPLLFVRGVGTTLPMEALPGTVAVLLERLFMMMETQK